MKKKIKSSTSSRRPANTKRTTRPKIKIGHFFPAVLISLFTSSLLVQSHLTAFGQKGVLAYATNTTISGLLSGTNSQRSAHGVGSLTLNSQLNAAAQSKAEDMVARDYWSHTTPDGQQPWVFMSNAGYSYTAAGENLAYGFATSGDTITGWMNSPSHKDNLLNSVFSEAGFGIANSPNYVGNGQQTVVVAMYGKPQVQSAATPAPVASQPASTPKAQPKATQSPAPAPTPEPVAETPVETPPAEISAEKEQEPVATNLSPTNLAEPLATPANIQRVQLLTRGAAAWSTTAVILGVLAIGLLWGIHKGIHLKRYYLAYEQYLARHLPLDVTVLSVIYLGWVLLGSSGVVR